jgi:gluconolactonase
MRSITVRIPAFAAVLLGAWVVAAAQAPVTPAIQGVLNAGTPIQLIKEGIEAVEGPVPLGDDVLFTNNRTNQILRIGRDGAVSTWLENTGGANALALNPQGEVVATCNVDIGITVLGPGKAPRVLTKGFDGKTFSRPNDLAISKTGHIYFTDSAPAGAASPPLPSSVYLLKAGGEITRVTADIGRPNGLALSPDERTLFVADTSGEYIIAFDIDTSGNAGNKRQFAKLALPPQGVGGAAPTSGTDGLAVDEQGRLYAATAVGVQVFSPRGEALGTITLPRQPQNLAFGGPGRSSLYVVGRGSVWRIATLTRGPQRAGK